MNNKFSKYDNYGFSSLANLGNTCFLNTVLQILNHTYELIELSKTCILQNQTTPIGISESKLFSEWIELNKLMCIPENTKIIVSPNKFVYYVQELAQIKENNIFTGWNQNDMSEFLLFLIDSMHNSISRGINMKISGNPENEKDNMACKCYSMMKTVYSKEYSEIMDLFYGITISHIDSLEEGKSYATNPEFFFILNLPIPETPNPTLIDCFDDYSNPEVLDGENCWFNETTKQKESVRKYTTFWNFPKILVVSLKRFTKCGRNKRQELVSFPLKGLDLSPYCEGYKNKKYVYELFGVGNHYGGNGGGHYTCFVKNSKNEWLHFNDTTVNTIDESQIITNNAYCLFYRMID